MLIDDLKAANLAARKNKDTIKANLLTTLVSEASMIGKNNGNRESTDEEVLRVIKKFLDNATETLRLVGNSNIAEQEIVILNGYMPKQLTEDELRIIIKNFKEYNYEVGVGAVMQYLQKNYSGRYDGKLASQIAKE